MLRLLTTFLFLLLLYPALIAAQSEQQESEYGWIERVTISPGGIELHAKLDTGADHCSLHAKRLQIFKKGNKKYARFLVRNREGEEVTIEARVLRTASIKRAEGGNQKRPVVKLYVCLGDRFMKVDVNLADRSQFAYPMLIGRSFLAGNAVINPSKTFTSDPICNFPQKNEE